MSNRRRNWKGYGAAWDWSGRGREYWCDGAKHYVAPITRPKQKAIVGKCACVPLTIEKFQELFALCSRG